MQGQRNTSGSCPEIVNINEGSVSNNGGTSQQNSSNSILNRAESRISEFMASTGVPSCSSGVSNDVQSFTGWHFGEPSSRLNLQNHFDGPGIKLEHGWSPLSRALVGPDPRSDERRFEQAGAQLPGRLNIGINSNQLTNGAFFSQGSSSNYVPPNVSFEAGSTGQNLMGCGIGPNLYKSGGLETGQISSLTAASGNVGTSSGSSGFVVENDGGSSSSLGNWGSSCKRKTLEGTSGHSYSSGSSSCFPQSENASWHSGSARYNASSSLNVSMPLQNSASTSASEQPIPRMGIGMRGVSSDSFPSLSESGNLESTHRNFGRRASMGHQQESLPFTLSPAGGTRLSSLCFPHPPLRPIPLSDSLDLRPTNIVTANSSNPENQSHVMHASSVPRNAQPFSWNMASNSRAGISSNSFVSGERSATLHEESNFRNLLRSNPQEHHMFGPLAELRSLTQDPSRWGLATGSSGNSGGVPPGTRVGSSSGIHPTPAWAPLPDPSVQNQRRPSEFAPWSLFPAVDSESVSHSGPFPQLQVAPSASPSEAAVSSGVNSQSRRQPHRRSTFLLERQGDDILGMPRSLRSLAADIEGRHRLITEIRQVLNAMRRGENVRVEDYMLFDPFIYHGIAEVHDRHRDMRLDVDNMSYEELLELEERIGDVSTGLSEETILKSMKQRKYISIQTETSEYWEPCCICQEDYINGDDVGTLDCGHDFHTNCIKQWLMQKNLCPICKTTALAT